MKSVAAVLVLVLVCLAGVVSANAQRRHHDNNNYNNNNNNNNAWRYNQNNNRWDSSWDNRANPGNGACFYATAPFRGHHFCVNAGDRLSSLPGGLQGNISSIQIFGNAEVRIFNGRDYSKGSRVVRRTVPDLRDLRFERGHTWNNRIQSIIVR